MFGTRLNWVYATLLGVYSFFNIILLDGDRLFQADLSPVQLFPLILILCYLVWTGNYLLERYLCPKFPRFHPLIFQFILSILVILGLALISMKVTGWVWGGAFDYTRQNFLLTLGFLFRINLFLNSIHGLIFFVRKYNEKKLEAERLRNLGVEAKLKSLNTQLNPHFFFNNLNSLAALIHEDVGLADLYIQKLSAIYRYFLKNKIQELVPLKEELDFLKTYIALLEIRFSKSLYFKLDIAAEVLSTMIPPAVLQLLVENIVKHNFFTETDTLTVMITATRNEIRIFNKKQPKKSLEESSGIGLTNISERFKFLNRSITILDTEDSFEVILPLIEIDEITTSGRRAARTATR